MMEQGLARLNRAAPQKLASTTPSSASTASTASPTYATPTSTPLGTPSTSMEFDQGRSEASSIVSEVPDYLCGLDTASDESSPSPARAKLSDAAETLHQHGGVPAPALLVPYVAEGASSWPAPPPLDMVQPVYYFSVPQTPVHYLDLSTRGGGVAAPRGPALTSMEFSSTSAGTRAVGTVVFFPTEGATNAAAPLSPLLSPADADGVPTAGATSTPSTAPAASSTSTTSVSTSPAMDPMVCLAAPRRGTWPACGVPTTCSTSVLFDGHAAAVTSPSSTPTQDVTSIASAAASSTGDDHADQTSAQYAMDTDTSHVAVASKLQKDGLTCALAPAASLPAISTVSAASFTSAHMVFDGMPCHQEVSTAHVLCIKVSHVLHPVTIDVLNQVFGPLGAEKVCVLEESPSVEAMVWFRSHQDVVQAQEDCNGRCIWDGCCVMDIIQVQPKTTEKCCVCDGLSTGASPTTLAEQLQASSPIPAWGSCNLLKIGDAILELNRNCKGAVGGMFVGISETKKDGLFLGIGEVFSYGAEVWQPWPPPVHCRFLEFLVVIIVFDRGKFRKGENAVTVTICHTVLGQVELFLSMRFSNAVIKCRMCLLHWWSVMDTVQCSACSDSLDLVHMQQSSWCSQSVELLDDFWEIMVRDFAVIQIILATLGENGCCRRHVGRRWPWFENRRNNALQLPSGQQQFKLSLFAISEAVLVGFKILKIYNIVWLCNGEPTHELMLLKSSQWISRALEIMLLEVSGCRHIILVMSEVLFCGKKGEILNVLERTTDASKWSIKQCVCLSPDVQNVQLHCPILPSVHQNHGVCLSSMLSVWKFSTTKDTMENTSFAIHLLLMIIQKTTDGEQEYRSEFYLSDVGRTAAFNANQASWDPGGTLLRLEGKPHFKRRGMSCAGPRNGPSGPRNHYGEMKRRGAAAVEASNRT